MPIRHVEWPHGDVTSQNLDDKLGVEPRGPEIRAAEAALEDGLDHVAWCELSSHGYVLVDVDERRTRGEWWHVATVLEELGGAAGWPTRSLAARPALRRAA